MKITNPSKTTSHIQIWKTCKSSFCEPGQCICEGSTVENFELQAGGSMEIPHPSDHVGITVKGQVEINDIFIK